jgi:hypothetical protein
MAARLGGAWDGRQSWRATDEFSEQPQILSGCRQEHFIFGSAPSSQSQPVKLEDALSYANRISTFLRSRRDCSKASVLASARTRSRGHPDSERGTRRIDVLEQHPASQRACGAGGTVDSEFPPSGLMASGSGRPRAHSARAIRNSAVESHSPTARLR